MNMNWLRKSFRNNATDKIVLEDTLASIHATTDIIMATPEDVEGNKERIAWINKQTSEFYNHKALEKGEGLVEAAVIFSLVLLVVVGLLMLAGTAGSKISEGIGMIAASIPASVENEAVYDKSFNNDWLSNLPLTKHALDGHPERNTDALAIRNKMASGGCGPVDVWICPDQLIITCKADSSEKNLQLGLYVASTMDWIISGLPARSAYWDSKKSGCSGPYTMLFP